MPGSNETPTIVIHRNYVADVGGIANAGQVDYDLTRTWTFDCWVPGCASLPLLAKSQGRLRKEIAGHWISTHADSVSEP